MSKDAQDLILKLLIYNPDNRITASQALKHPYFKELREADEKQNFSITQPVMYQGGGKSDKEDEQKSQIEGLSNLGSTSNKYMAKVKPKKRPSDHNGSHMNDLVISSGTSKPAAQPVLPL